LPHRRDSEGAGQRRNGRFSAARGRYGEGVVLTNNGSKIGGINETPEDIGFLGYLYSKLPFSLPMMYPVIKTSCICVTDVTQLFYENCSGPRAY